MKTLIITGGIYPLGGGRQLASSGMCYVFSKYKEVVVFSLLDPNVSETDANAQGYPFETHFYHSKGYENIIREALFRPIELFKARLAYLKPLYKTYTTEIEKYLKKGDTDVIIIDHVMMGLYFEYFKTKFPNIRFIYNSHNVEYINTFAEYYEQPVFSRGLFGKIKRKFAWTRCSMRKNIERKLVNTTDFTFCISVQDKITLASEFGNADKLIFSKPIIEFDPIKDISDMDTYTKNLLVVGSMNWYPNVSGIIWFIKNVFAKFVENDPAYHLYIVGRDPHKELVEIADTVPNVIVTGSVSSTDEYFKKCDVSVVPVFEGTGAKIKVLESIARRIPTVCSDFAAKDYSVNGEILTATTADEFISCINEIESSVNLRRKLYNDMVQYYRDYFNVSGELLNALKAKESC